jgi:threonine dehydrogenase-like Zn-dependent dehydrogenase
VAVLREFGAPLAREERALPEVGPGEARVRVTAAGVCGSDVHMWEGRDPRIRLPLVLGHEGVGVVEQIGDDAQDLRGRPVRVGDPVIWERSLTCGRCHYCAVRKQPYLCPSRQVYGILRDGSYATHLLLAAGTRLLRLEPTDDPAVVAPAACAGATVAHAAEAATIRSGDAVLVLGPGPLGIFACAFARERGAKTIIAFGTERSRKRLELCREFGADHVMTVDGSTAEERAAKVHELTAAGADVVLDCAGSASAIREGLALTAPGGVYCAPGIATPLGETPVRFFEDVGRKNLRIQGVWVSDASHMVQAVELVQSGRYPFEKLISHRGGLNRATELLEAVRDRQATKAVICPGLEE